MSQKDNLSYWDIMSKFILFTLILLSISYIIEFGIN